MIARHDRNNSKADAVGAARHFWQVLEECGYLLLVPENKIPAES